MSKIDWDSFPLGGDLYGELQLAETKQSEPSQPQRFWSGLWPGLSLCAVAAATAAWLSDHYGFPIILLGLLIGLALNFITQDQRTHQGLDFAARYCLRFGIVTLGLQVTLNEISTLGLLPFAALVAVMATTIAAGLAGAYLFGQTRFIGILAGASTAICGASAALAVYGVIGKERLSQAQFALTLVGVSLASAFAMSVYPIVAEQIGLNDRQAGFLIGASIHDVAQAIGGGYSYSDQAGAYATIVKLARVAALAPLVLLIGLWLGRGDAQDDKQGHQAERPSLWQRLKLPWFITAFLLVVLFNSLVTVPPFVSDSSLGWSKALLLMAVTATAMRSRMDLLVKLGWHAITPVLTATGASFLVALFFAKYVVE